MFKNIFKTSSNFNERLERKISEYVGKLSKENIDELKRALDTPEYAGKLSKENIDKLKRELDTDLIPTKKTATKKDLLITKQNLYKEKIRVICKIQDVADLLSEAIKKESQRIKLYGGANQNLVSELSSELEKLYTDVKSAKDRTELKQTTDTDLIDGKVKEFLEEIRSKETQSEKSSNIIDNRIKTAVPKLSKLRKKLFDQNDKLLSLKKEITSLNFLKDNIHYVRLYGGEALLNIENPNIKDVKSHIKSKEKEIKQQEKEISKIQKTIYKEEKKNSSQSSGSELNDIFDNLSQKDKDDLRSLGDLLMEKTDNERLRPLVKRSSIENPQEEYADLDDISMSKSDSAYGSSESLTKHLEIRRNSSTKGCSKA